MLTQNIYIHTHHHPTTNPQRPLGEAYSVAIFASVLITGLVWLLVNDYGLHFLYFCLLPYLVAGTGLAYSFDYAPHRPHAVDRCVVVVMCVCV